MQYCKYISSYLKVYNMHGTDAKNVHCTFWNHWANCFGDIFLTLSYFLYTNVYFSSVASI